MFRFSGLFNEENGLYFCNDDASHFGRSNGFGGKSWNVLISWLRGKKIKFFRSFIYIGKILRCFALKIIFKVHDEIVVR